jgi:hypothetical protein
MQPRFQDRPMLQKPFQMNELRDSLAGLVPTRAGRAKPAKTH